MGKSEGRRVNAAKSFGKNKIIIIICISIAAIVGTSGYALAAKRTVKKWENKIYPGITVDSVDIGGMSKKEATEKLKKGIENQIQNKTVVVDVGEKEFTLKYSDISPVYDTNKAIQDAFDMDKQSGVLSQYSSIKKAEVREVPISFKYDENKLKEFEEKIKKEVNTEPENATLLINGDKIKVQKEKNGKTIDDKELDKQIRQSLKANSNQVIRLELKNEKAKITEKDLVKIKGAMGTYSTSYGTSPEGRCTNIELATSKLNGTIVMPGEEFSFNEIVGDRSKERGFKEAGTYVGNKVEPGIGGGICQVSSTLYRAAMRANLRSTERSNHSMVVGYMDPGLDATVAYGSLDYKFKNTYDFPIYIQGVTAGKVVTYTIYGDPGALKGKTYEMTNEIVETYAPEVKEVPDDTLPEGQRVADGISMTGYKVKSYQITYEKGVEIKRELVSTDYYAKVDSIVKVGTMKAEQTEEADGTGEQADSQTNANGKDNNGGKTNNETDSKVQAPPIKENTNLNVPPVENN